MEEKKKKRNSETETVKKIVGTFEQPEFTFKQIHIYVYFVLFFSPNITVQ